MRYTLARIDLQPDDRSCTGIDNASAARCSSFCLAALALAAADLARLRRRDIG